MEWASSFWLIQVRATFTKRLLRRGRGDRGLQRRKFGRRPTKFYRVWEPCTEILFCIGTWKVQTFSSGTINTNWVIWMYRKWRTTSNWWQKPKRGHLSTQVQKFGGTNLTAVLQIFGPLGALSMKCAVWNHLSMGKIYTTCTNMCRGELTSRFLELTQESYLCLLTNVWPIGPGKDQQLRNCCGTMG